MRIATRVVLMLIIAAVPLEATGWSGRQDPPHAEPKKKLEAARRIDDRELRFVVPEQSEDNGHKNDARKNEDVTS